MAFVPDEQEATGGFVPDEEPSRALRLGARLATGAVDVLRGGPMGAITFGMGKAQEGLSEAGKMAGDATVDVMGQVSGRRSLLNPLALKIPAEAQAAAATVAELGLPMLVGGVTGAKVGEPVMKAGAKRLMQSAIRPGSKALANDDAARAIDTMLRENIPASTGGAVKLRHLITKLKGEVVKEINAAPGAMVDKAHVYRELASTLDDVSKLGRPEASREAVLKAWEQFKNHPLAKGGEIPVGLADEMKRATQRVVKDAYGRMSSTPVDDKIDMAIAAGLRKGVEEAVPAVGPMNAKLSEYINALHQLEPRAAQAANMQLGGLVPLAHSPEAAMLMLADRNPWMKSAIARVLYAGRKGLPAAAGASLAAPSTE
jgi:hypothetical protein